MSFQYLARESYKGTIYTAHTHNYINKGMKPGGKKDVEGQPADFQWNIKIVVSQRSKSKLRRNFPRYRYLYEGFDQENCKNWSNEWDSNKRNFLYNIVERKL